MGSITRCPGGACSCGCRRRSERGCGRNAPDTRLSFRRRNLSAQPEEQPMSIDKIAQRLVALCREGKYEQAQKELYDDEALSLEPEGLPPGALGDAEGLDAIIEKGHQFQSMIETFHGGHVSDPVIAGNWFSIAMTLDVTMKGRGRVEMTEICVYRVTDGKIDVEQFFYDVE
jgi:hypothetical protein